MAHFTPALGPDPGGWYPSDDNEPLLCGYCGKDLPLIEGTDDAGRPVAQFGNDDHQSLMRVQCCSAGCAQLADLDITIGLEAMARYFERWGGALPEMTIGFRRVPPAAYARELLRRHKWALNEGGVKELVRENADA